MAKPNYSYEKRQRELAKKKKKEEKLQRKTAPRDPNAPPETEASGDTGAEPAPLPADGSPAP